MPGDANALVHPFPLILAPPGTRKFHLRFDKFADGFLPHMSHPLALLIPGAHDFAGFTLFYQPEPNGPELLLQLHPVLI